MAVIWAAGTGQLQAIINPRFTPAEMVRQAVRIFVLEVSLPQEGAVSARVVRALKGGAGAPEKISLALSPNGEPSAEDVASAFEGGRSAAAVLLLSRRGQRGDEDAPAGVIQINTRWFAVVGTEGRWRLAADKRDMFSVWAGSAEMLARAVQYVLDDPRAAFPVKSQLSWGGEALVGTMGGRPAACLWIAADDGTGGLLVLSSGGDRLWRWGGGRTAEVSLPGASQLACPGDFDGDGRIDLACWDGKTVKLAQRRTNGTFFTAGDGLALDDCLSLEAIDVGGGRGLLAGTSDGPRIIRIDDRGAMSPAEPLTGPAKQAASGRAAGPCVAADVDGDGRCDIVQVREGGLAIWRGGDGGRYGSAEIAAVNVVRRPRTVICGDYDADGKLDLLVGGSDGLALLMRDENGSWHNVNVISGELAYHGNANQPEVAALSPCDINGDGRQGMAAFYPRRSPLVFFNRGFACFGWARELDFAASGEAEAANVMDPLALGQAPQAKLKAAEALQRGSLAGVMADFDGDGSADMAAVDSTGKVWAVMGRLEGARGRVLTVRLGARARGPVVVRCHDEKRLRGMYLLRPGLPVMVGREQGCAVSLRWLAADGRPHSRNIGPDETGPIEIEP